MQKARFNEPQFVLLNRKFIQAITKLKNSEVWIVGCLNGAHWLKQIGYPPQRKHLGYRYQNHNKHEVMHLRSLVQFEVISSIHLSNITFPQRRQTNKERDESFCSRHVSQRKHCMVRFSVACVGDVTCSHLWSIPVQLPTQISSFPTSFNIL